MRIIQLNIYLKLSSILLILAISSVVNISHSAEVLGSAIFHTSSGKCFQPFGGSSDPGNGTDVVVHENGCNNKENKVLFLLTGDGHIKHSYSKKCLQPKNGASYPANGTLLSLNDNNCAGDWKFKLTSSGSLKHIKSGKCIHPYGGSSNPGNNTPLVLWSGCDETRLSYTISPDNLLGSPLIHKSSGKCSQPFGGSSNPGNGTDVVVHNDGCNNKDNKVLFHLTGDGYIKHSYSKKCLQPKNGASYPANGTHLSLNDNNCAGDWKFKQTLNGSLMHIKSGKCIHPYGGSGDPGNNTPLVLWDGCFGGRIAFGVDGDNINNSYTTISDKRSNKCLTFSGTMPSNGAKAILWECQNTNSQQWHYNQNTGLLHNKANSGFCLDNAAQPRSGGVIYMWACNNNNINQKWDFVGRSIRPRANNNIAIDAYGTSNGSTIGQWSYHGGSNQLWY